MSDMYTRHGGVPIGAGPFQNQNHFHFPGGMSPPGFTIPNAPLTDPASLEGKYRDEHFNAPKPQEVKHLNQYTGYFTTPEGDFPVTVVADSIKEASKILTMPGVYGDGTTEPTTIKFVKGTVAVSVPVRMSGFNVNIDPIGAKESGAYATPVHAEVKNGTEVIFTAHEPFGWKFVGWYKGDQLLSTEAISWIEVYDPYSSLIEYTAKYEFDPVYRNGRYIDHGHGWYFDFKFDGWSTSAGKMILYARQIADWHFILTSIDTKTGIVTAESDPTVVQDSGLGLTFTMFPTAIGINIVFTNVTMDNPFGLVMDQQLNLVWVGDHDKIA